MTILKVDRKARKCDVKCDTSFGVVKIVMATENSENFHSFSRRFGEKRASFGEKSFCSCAPAALPCAFHVMTAEIQFSIRFRLLSRSFAMRWDAFLWDWSRDFSFSLCTLSSASLSLKLVDSPSFPPDSVELDKRGYRDDAWRILERDTSKHMEFAETEIPFRARAKAKNSLKKDFRWGFSLNFPRISPRLGCLGWVGWSQKSHVEPPTAMCRRYQQVADSSNKSADSHWRDDAGHVPVVKAADSSCFEHAWSFHSGFQWNWKFQRIWLQSALTLSLHFHFYSRLNQKCRINKLFSKMHRMPNKMDQFRIEEGSDDELEDVSFTITKFAAFFLWLI